MSTTLGRVANGAVALTLVFGLAACGESALDLQKKPELVDLLVDRAVATCAMQQSELDQAPYANRLEDVLMEARAKTLEFFKENGTTICLDKRLETQQETFMSKFANGIFYPDDNILTLWDNGKSDAQKWFYQWSATSDGYKYLEKFQNEFGGAFSDYKTVSDVQHPMIGYSYRASCGKNCSRTKYDWQDVGEFWSSDAITLNPQLASPPVITAP